MPKVSKKVEEIYANDFELEARYSITGVTFTLMFVVGILLLSSLAATDEVMKLNYQSRIGHHVQEAFNTVSGPASSEQLGIAINEIKISGLDQGYTNWIWKSKCGDLGFWFRTLVQAKADVDRASYEKAWNPEADENAILARHFKVLTDTYGPSLSPCAIHQGQFKPLFDLGEYVFIFIPSGGIGIVIRAAVRHMESISSTIVIKNNKPVIELTDGYGKSNSDAGFLKTWKIKKS